MNAFFNTGAIISWLAENGVTLGSAITYALVALVLWKLRNLTRAIDNVYSRTTTFLVLVADKLKLKTDYYSIFPSGFLPSNLTSNSPLGLSRRGVKVGEKLNAARTAQDLLPKLLKMIAKNPSKQEVQAICMNFAVTKLLNNVDEDVRQNILREIYNDGGNLENTLMVYGIVFRDAVFKKLGMERDGAYEESMESQ